jgi:FkbM family methyltransferase
MAVWTAPQGKVVAFEPNSRARMVLGSNVRLNGFDGRIFVEEFAVADAAGQAPFFHDGQTHGISRLGAPNPDLPSGQAVAVDVVTLDGYCETHAVAPRWVLIDTEGREVDVLAGAARLLADPRVTFVVEMHPTLWPDGQTAVARLRQMVSTHGRTIVPLTGQADIFAEYGTIVI